MPNLNVLQDTALTNNLNFEEAILEKKKFDSAMTTNVFVSCRHHSYTVTLIIYSHSMHIHSRTLTADGCPIFRLIYAIISIAKHIIVNI